jgi:hypothetical protein
MISKNVCVVSLMWQINGVPDESDRCAGQTSIS